VSTNRTQPYEESAIGARCVTDKSNVNTNLRVVNNLAARGGSPIANRAIVMRVLLMTTFMVSALCAPSFAQEHQASPTPASSRVFGVLPNYTTVDGETPHDTLSSASMFALTAKNTFDPAVCSFVGFTSALQGGPGSYTHRYAVAFADNAIGNFMTSAALPALLHQDPRYYRQASGTGARRAAYALSRILVTRSIDGQRVVNTSELSGTFVAGMAGNAYHGSADRTVASTLSRWGTQLLWDAVSNELKEFWPDVRDHLHKH